MSSDNQQLEEFLGRNGQIKFIRFQWMDYSGVLRARFVPVARALRVAQGIEDCRLAQNSMLIPISTAPKIFSLSDHHETWFLRPNWSSLRVCGTYSTHATVMSFVDQKEAGTRFDKCPRMLLSQALERLERGQWSSKVTIGFEIEFVFLDKANEVVKPLDRLNGYSRTAGLRSETLDLIDEIVKALEVSSINVYHFYSEVSDQLEIALGPEPALAAVDSLVIAQEIIRTICIRHGIKASMAPKPTMDGPTNGLHLHLSASGLKSPLTDHFLAGVLNHMAPLCAFGMANYDSYVRAVDDAAGAWVGFGTDNRDLPVRKISDAHWEFRMMDGAANPYLFTAGVLLAAIDGLQHQTDLSWHDCKFFLSIMDKEMRVKHGMDKAMPTSLYEALHALRRDSALSGLISEDLLKWFVSVKDKEVETFVKMTDEQRRARFLEYF